MLTGEFHYDDPWRNLLTSPIDTIYGHQKDDVNLDALRRDIATHIADRYGTGSRLNEYTDEVVLEVPRATKPRVSFRWKEIWQHGVAQVHWKGKQYEVPFTVIVGVTYEMKTGIKEYLLSKLPSSIDIAGTQLLKEQLLSKLPPSVGRLLRARISEDH